MDLNAGDTAWVLAATALVLIMTPGLAFFYGGMTRSKSVLNMMMMSFVTIGIVSILWVIYGFAEAFGDGTSAFIGTPTSGRLSGFRLSGGGFGPEALIQYYTATRARISALTSSRMTSNAAA